MSCARYCILMKTILLAGEWAYPKRKKIQKGMVSSMENFEALKAQYQEELKSVNGKEELGAFWQKYLGKTGQIQDLMKKMKDVPKEEKPEYGKKVNEVRTWAQDLYQAKADEIKLQEEEKRYKAEAIDVTIPSEAKVGNLHPITLVKQEIIEIFAGMGFEIFEGPEIEDDDHNFTRLNVLKDHPARDMQDTFWLTEDLLLRTHTSPGQIRVMDKKKPPIKVLVPGRVFRSDSDATHSPMFSQMEGLVVDKNITLCDLQGMLDEFVKNIFSSDARTRLRPSYFPFTEPSVEVDVSCFECGGKGCPLCKGTGWIEVLGGGVVNNKVLENCNIDPNEYSGIAFGIGIERITMLKYGINHMGVLFENDVNFLKQFKA